MVGSLNCSGKDIDLGFSLKHAGVMPVGMVTLGFVGTNCMASGFKLDILLIWLN